MKRPHDDDSMNNKSINEEERDSACGPSTPELELTEPRVRAERFGGRTRKQIHDDSLFGRGWCARQSRSGHRAWQWCSSPCRGGGGLFDDLVRLCEFLLHADGLPLLLRQRGHSTG